MVNINLFRDMHSKYQLMLCISWNSAYRHKASKTIKIIWTNSRLNFAILLKTHCFFLGFLQYHNRSQERKMELLERNWNSSSVLRMLIFHVFLCQLPYVYSLCFLLLQVVVGLSFPQLTPFHSLHCLIPRSFFSTVRGVSSAALFSMLPYFSS